MLARKIVLKGFGGSLNLNISRGLCCTVASTSKHRDSLLTSYKLNRPICAKSRRFSLNFLFGPSSKVAAQTDLQTGADSLLSGQSFADIEAQVGFLPDIPPIPAPAELADVLGQLQALGLGSWYWPSGWVQNFLDAMHNMGIEWWGAIGILVLIVRTLILPTSIYNQRETAKFHNFQPQVQKLQQRWDNAKMSGDAFRESEGAMEFMEFIKKNDCSPLKRFKTIPITMFVFISCFAGIRGLAKAPYPGWESAGALWFTDLTVTDPYYLLPAISAATVFFVMESGIETGVQLKDQPSSWKVKTAMRVGIPAVVFAFSAFQPAAIAMYWCFSNSYSLGMALVLRQQSIRDFCRIPVMKQHDPKTLAALSAGNWKPKQAMSTSRKIATGKNMNIQALRAEDRKAFVAAGQGNRPKTTTKFLPKTKKWFGRS